MVDILDYLFNSLGEYALKRRLKDMRTAGASPNQTDRYRDLARTLFTPYKPAQMKGVKLTPGVDPSIFASQGVIDDPFKQGFLVYLINQTYTLKNGVILPFAATIHEGSEAAPIILEYVLNNSPSHAEKAIQKRLREEKIRLDKMESNPALFKRDIQEWQNADSYVNNPFRSDDRVLRDMKDSAQSLIDRLELLREDPAANLNLAGLVVDYLKIGHSGLPVEYFTDFDSDLFGRNLGEPIFAVADYYRMLESDKLDYLSKQ